MINLIPGMFVCRWSTDKAPDADQLAFGYVEGPSQALPGRWRIRVSLQVIEHWHAATILRAWSDCQQSMGYKLAANAIRHTLATSAREEAAPLDREHERRLVIDLLKDKLMLRANS